MKLLLALLVVLAFAAGTLGAPPGDDGQPFDARELARRGGGKKRGGGGKSRWPEGCDPSGLKDFLKQSKEECKATCTDDDDVDVDLDQDGNRMLKKRGSGGAKGGKGGEEGKEYRECKKAVLADLFSEVGEKCRETCAQSDGGDDAGDDDVVDDDVVDDDDEEDDAIADDGNDGRKCMQKCLSDKCGLEPPKRGKPEDAKNRMLRRGGKGGRDDDGSDGDSDKRDKRECVKKCADFCGAKGPKGKGPGKAQRKSGSRGGKGGKGPSACMKKCVKENKPSKDDVEDAFNAADCVDPFACERTCFSEKREEWLSANGCAKPEDDE